MNNQEFLYITTPLRAAAILTNEYVAATVVENVQMSNQLVLQVDFTKGNLTSAEVKIEFANDAGATDYYQEVNSLADEGTSTIYANEYSFVATGKYAIPVPIKARYIKVSAKGTGTVTNSSMKISAVVGVA